MIFIEDLELAILALQRAALHRMHGKNKAPHESYDFKLPLPQGLVIRAPQPHHTHFMRGVDGDVESLDMEGLMMGSSFGGSSTNNMDNISQVLERVE